MGFRIHRILVQVWHLNKRQVANACCKVSIWSELWAAAFGHLPTSVSDVANVHHRLSHCQATMVQNLEVCTERIHVSRNN